MSTLRRRLERVEERIALQQHRELQRQFQGRSRDEQSFFIIHGYWPENAGDILPHRLEFAGLRGDPRQSSSPNGRTRIRRHEHRIVVVQSGRSENPFPSAGRSKRVNCARTSIGSRVT
jgi:hypothetical protein